MKSALAHLILAVKAKFAGVTITSKTEEQIDVVEATLEPEGGRVYVVVLAE